MSADREDLLAQLDRARTLGFLGPGPVAGHLRHAAGFVAALAEVPAGPVVDLGSGGGVPGLVVAMARPDLELLLVDSVRKRCGHLEVAVEALGLAGRVQVRCERAEVLGRGDQRGRAAAVLARSFAPPAPTAECAAPLLQVGGRLLVSEPPGAPDRWPPEPLAALGLVLGPRLDEPALQVLVQEAPCPDRFPRRVGIPVKRPLF